MFIQNKILFYKKIRDIPKFGLSNMVYADFRDSRWDIQDSPSAQLDPGAAQDPHDEERMEARPDQEELEEAIINFLLLLEKQKKKGFKDFKAWPHIIPVVQGCTGFCSLDVSGRRGRRRLKTSLSTAPDKDHSNLNKFTLSEPRLYQHAQDHCDDHRLNWDIPG